MKAKVNRADSQGKNRFPKDSNSFLINVSIWNLQLRLETDPRLFSPRHADNGTLAMMKHVELQPSDRVLDLGCGYGLVGLAAARILGPGQVTLIDNDPLAVELARRNSRLNGVAGVRIIEGDGPQVASPDQFTLILCNPPYHADFSTARHFIEQGWQRLVEGGRLILVVKRLLWYKNKMTAVFGGVQVWSEGDYHVLISEKRPPLPTNKGVSNDAGVGAGVGAATGAGIGSGLGAGARLPEKATTRKHQAKMEVSRNRHQRPGQSDSGTR